MDESGFAAMIFLRPRLLASRSFAASAFVVAWCAIAIAGADPQPFEIYQVDAGASDIHWRVYRAGAFSRLGHNHVISVGDLSGVVRRDPSGAASSFELTIPVAGLIVDDPEMRRKYGDELSSEPSADDIAGTRRNMLGKKVLRAQQHPVIRVTGTPVGGASPSELAVTVELLGRTVAFSVPCELSEGGGVLMASGEFSLTHADVGLKPFKVMLGALAVAKTLDFSYRVQAVRSEPPVPGPAGSD